MSRQTRTGKDSVLCRACTRMLAVCLCAVVLSGCGTSGPTSTPDVNVAPTATETPSGDRLLIDGVPILHVIVPDESQGPAYGMTADWLFRRSGSDWEQTGAVADGRVVLADGLVPEQLYRGNHGGCLPQAATAEIAFETSADSGATWTVQPEGANVRPLLADPVLVGTVYGSDCGLAISHDSGVTWIRLDPMPAFPIVDVAVDGTLLYVLGVSVEDDGRLQIIDLSAPDDPVADAVVLEAVGLRALDALDGRVVVGGVYGVYVSDDGGVNWSESRLGLEAVTRGDQRPHQRGTAASSWDAIGVLAIELMPKNKHRMLAGTPSGLYVSQDDGATWVRYDEVSVAEPILDIQFALDGADVLVTSEHGVVLVPSP